MKASATVALLFATVTFVAGPSYAAHLSDAQIKRAMIQDSIASYPGTCPCPYSVARNGSRCGRRSAYSRAGGYAPLCYASDVTAQMIADYRRTH
jgi:hypothetical protein